MAGSFSGMLILFTASSFYYNSASKFWATWSSLTVLLSEICARKVFIYWSFNEPLWFNGKYIYYNFCSWRTFVDETCRRNHTWISWIWLGHALHSSHTYFLIFLVHHFIRQHLRTSWWNPLLEFHSSDVIPCLDWGRRTYWKAPFSSSIHRSICV